MGFGEGEQVYVIKMGKPCWFKGKRQREEFVVVVNKLSQFRLLTKQVIEDQICPTEMITWRENKKPHKEEL